MAELRECPICRVQRQARRRGDWQACRECGTAIRTAPPSPGDLEGYYRAAFGSERGPMYATAPEIARQYTQLIERATKELAWPGSRILDYGAGEGQLTARLSALGAQVVAVEPYGARPHAAEGAASHRSLDELEREEPFDGIVMTEVIEHLPDPVEVVRKLRSHLRKNGWIFVTTPNVGSLKARLLRGGWSERRKLGHLYLFSRDGLERSLSEGGFGRVEACTGLVSFSTSNRRSVVQHLLQKLHLDGQLRVMAWNTSGGSRLGE